MFLEHVNLSVSDLERSIAFYNELFGFEVRWRGFTSDGQPAAHVGDQRCYLALFQASAPGHLQHDYEHVGFNHFGFVVESLENVRERLSRMQITPHLEGDYEPGRRLYFHDPDGVEIELVEYESSPATRPAPV